MIVLQASHLTKSFDGKDVLKDASLVMQERDRIAVIGTNGAGKTTLLRLLTGELQPDGGEVSITKGLTIGYVSQYAASGEENLTVYDFVGQAFSGVHAVESELRAAEEEMGRPDVYTNDALYEAVVERYALLQKTFEDMDGYSVDANIRRVLDGLDFSPALHSLPTGQLSGGQKTRLSLARLLASRPNILLLDEPSNYLDTDTLSWLESYLVSYAGAMVVVSHDRYFLDKVATTIVEVNAGRTLVYPGNYTDYVESKAASLASQTREFEAQQKEIARMEQFVQKNIVRASTTKRAQSRRRMLEKLVPLERPQGASAKLSLSFQEARPSGRDVLLVDHASIGYGTTVLATDIQLNVQRGQRIAIIGPNGVGKTTFLRTLIGQLPALSGHVQWGAHVELGYSDQEQASLDFSKTVLEQLWDDYPTLDRTTIRTALGRFLFRGEDVETPVSGLSGGEKSRLNLCRLMLQQSNTLVLDEPTNHLDLTSKEVLEDALEDFTGTLLFVSHDRYFIDAIATHVAVLSPSGISLYPGNYSDYQHKLEELAKYATHSSATEVVLKKSAHSFATMDSAALSRSSVPRIRSSDMKKLRDRVATLEQSIAESEQKQSELAFALTEAATNQDMVASQSLQKELHREEQRTEELWKEWEIASLDLEKLMAVAELSTEE